MSLLALSYSGETEELIRLLESIRRIGARLIAMTAIRVDARARRDVTLNCGIAKEACP
jgi:arabinose-5-phosphate isomerase